MENMKMIFCHNLIKNCPVTTEDVKLTNIIFGPDISTLKGPSTRPNPVQVIDDSIDIPKKTNDKKSVIGFGYWCYVYWHTADVDYYW